MTAPDPGEVATGTPRPSRPLRIRRAGPLVLTLWPADHPTANLEVVVTVVGALALASFLLLPLDRLAELLPPCTFHRLTGHPCPTCGTTRILLALARGRVGEALALNPLMAGLVLGFALWVPIAAAQWILRLPRWRLGLASVRARWVAAALVVLAVLADWAFVVYRGL